MNKGSGREAISARNQGLLQNLKADPQLRPVAGIVVAGVFHRRSHGDRQQSGLFLAEHGGLNRLDCIHRSAPHFGHDLADRMPVNIVLEKARKQAVGQPRVRDHHRDTSTQPEAAQVGNPRALLEVQVSQHRGVRIGNPLHLRSGNARARFQTLIDMNSEKLIN